MLSIQEIEKEINFAKMTVQKKNHIKYSSGFFDYDSWSWILNILRIPKRMLLTFRGREDLQNIAPYVHSNYFIL